MPPIPRVFRSAFTKYAFIFPALQLLVFVPVQWSRTDQDRDTYAYYLAAERVRDGEPMYEPHPPPGPHTVDHWYYLYPPFFASLLGQTPRVPFETFSRIWLLVLLAGFWVFAASLGHIASGRTTVKGTLLAGALLHLFPGTVPALNMGQADVLVWAMIGSAIAYPAFRGAGLMAAGLTKVHGFWPLGVSLLRERRRVLGSAFVVAALAVASAAVALGPQIFLQSTIEWFREVVPALSQGQFDSGNRMATLLLPFGLPSLDLPFLTPPNLSITFAPLQLAYSLGWWAPSPGNLPSALRFYLSATALVAPLLVAWSYRHRSPELQCVMVLSAALLFSPILKLTNLPMFLLPITVYYSERRAASAGSAPSADIPPTEMSD